jgi:hypothetical protein
MWNKVQDDIEKQTLCRGWEIKCYAGMKFCTLIVDVWANREVDWNLGHFQGHIFIIILAKNSEKWF